MPNNYFNFKQFSIKQDKSAFKVGTDSVILGAYMDLTGAKRILDIGTGSGLLALMSAQKSEADIIALEADCDSCNQASENFAASRWSDRLTAINQRIQDFPGIGGKFDVIVSNPPYFSNSLKNPDYRKANSRHNDSLTFGELVQAVGKFLSVYGKFWVILPADETEKMIKAAEKILLYPEKILKIYPKPNSQVSRIIYSFSRMKNDILEEEMTVEETIRHHYTEKYRELTKDFYL
jgi:tRNA1Val (adenine37-N6)-methyltransferase